MHNLSPAEPLGLLLLSALIVIPCQEYNAFHTRNLTLVCLFH